MPASPSPTTMEPFEFPDNIPALPQNPLPWSANVITARQLLDNVYVRALQTLREEDSDPLRYKLLSSNIIDTMIPVLEGMDGEVPQLWIHACAEIFGPLVYELQVSALTAEGIERDEIELLQPVSEEQTGRLGRPRKHVDPEYPKIFAQFTGGSKDLEPILVISEPHPCVYKPIICPVFRPSTTFH
ncbi:hypothetical protein C8F04DRAFT_1176814 [Mycena alexandri]|uniref:Uncharacterized protein n=1 Tax=Mycena alexandri TaxID=1745969 RepID=A0AAD6XDY1_9AGAR|nr:hypothetical protein C8F04DRAFT_1176814 [Mycena alexandri]